jgi:hypothetical protein
MNPYKLDGPSIISFSGGRTSAFMLRQILDAHNGELPQDAHVIFCNTGLEHHGTYRFINEIAINWNVPIVWLEWRQGRKWERVSYETASRNGEPFSALIDAKNGLPNLRMRFCTQELKIFTIKRYAEQHLKFDEWTEIIGLRYDEPRRVARLDRWPGSRDVFAPMYHAKHDLSAVKAYWSSSPFDLDIPPNAGNCVGCFLKGANKLSQAVKESPSYFDWWVRMESRVFTLGDGKEKVYKFNLDKPPYAHIVSASENQNELFGDDTLPCACTD